ncbi:MAG: GNAT family N-acetyltransferase [Alphaproteobacteria bacterium]|nr:GNAT family N-acetyltransferase [Alphaproteobacteria bacterium]
MERETARLRLRPPRLSDAPALLSFFSDARAQRYTLHFGTLYECRRHIAVHERHRRRVGCGPWLVSEKASDAVIGWGGLYEDPLDRRWGIEVAYSFARSTWGQGYARELVSYSLDVARDELGLSEIVAFSHADNAGSRRVLEKAGFAFERYIPDMERNFYRRRL